MWAIGRRVAPRDSARHLALISAVLLVVVGCAGDAGAPDGVTDPQPDTEVSDEDGEVAASFAVVGTNDLQFDPDELTAPAGTIEIELTCDAAMHDFVLMETGEELAACMPGETDRGTVTLDPGEYTFQCTVPGHSRMNGTLTVEDAAAG